MCVCAGDLCTPTCSVTVCVCVCMHTVFKVCVCPGGVEDVHTLHGAVCVDVCMCSRVHCERG